MEDTIVICVSIILYIFLSQDYIDKEGMRLSRFILTVIGIQILYSIIAHFIVFPYVPNKLYLVLNYFSLITWNKERILFNLKICVAFICNVYVLSELGLFYYILVNLLQGTVIVYRGMNI